MDEREPTGEGAFRRDRTVRHGRIDSLRGLSALAVAAVHSGQAIYLTADGKLRMLAYEADGSALPDDPLSSLYFWVANGHGAVALFFVISGYVLSLSLDRMGSPGFAMAGRFLGRRLLRLWPPILFMLGCFVALFLFTGRFAFSATPADFEPVSLLRHALLLESRINGVVWTLRIELFAAPVVLLLWLGARRWGEAFLWAAFWLFFALIFTDSPDRWLRAHGAPANPYVHFLHAFAAGMLVAHRESVGRGPPRIPLGSAALWLLGGLVLFFAAPLFGLASNWRQVGEAAGSAAMVMAVASGLAGGRLLDLAPLRFLGRISFSFYLLQPVALFFVVTHFEMLSRLVALGVPPVVLAIAVLAVTTLATIPLAALSYGLCEVPSMRLGRRLGASSSSMAPSPGRLQLRNQRASSQQNIAQAEPAHQPASTSVGQ